MFCTNCGSKLPEGSKFCSECGARLAQAEPAVESVAEPVAANLSWNEPEEKAGQPVARRHTVAFDWSNVKEESHRKPVTEVHSPWGTTGLSEKELFAESDDTQEDHSRTMSFIDILKKERDAKAQEAEEAARPVTDKEAVESDYTVFQEAPSFYVPPLYDNVDAPVTTPYDEQKHASEISLEEPAVKPELSFNDEMVDEEPEEEEHSFDISDYDFDGVEEETSEKYRTTSFNEPDIKATEDLSDLESSLAAILDAGAGRAMNEEKVDLFEEKPVEEPSEFVADDIIEDFAPEDMYLSMEEPATSSVEPVAAPVEEVAPVQEEVSPVMEEVVFSEQEIEAPVVEEITPAQETAAPVMEEAVAPVMEEIVAPAQEAVIEEPVVETPAEEPETVEDEIEALKRRLAELMGTTVEPEEEPEEVAKADELSLEDLIAAPVGEAVVAEPVVVEEPVVAAEPIAVEEPVVVEEPVAAEEPVAEVVPETPVVPSEDIFDVQLRDEEPEDIFDVQLRDEEPEEIEEETIEVVNEEPANEAASEVAEVAEAEEEAKAEEEAPVEPASDAISLDELERDLFGETTPEEIEQEETKKIDKFYTLYKKNEEFQKLLDEEYSKLRGEEQVPHVDDFIAEKEPEPETVAPVEQPVVTAEPVMTEQPVFQQMPIAETPVARPVEQVAAPVAVAPQEVVESKPSKAELKAAKKAAKAAAKAADDDDEEGGSKVLTVLAIIIAIILVILLGVIVILNFFPDSAIGIKIDSIVSTTTSYFSAVGGSGRFLS